MPFLLLLLVLHLFGQSTSSAVTAASNGSIAVFPILPTDRGEDIASMFTTLNTTPYKKSQSQVSVQTTRNGLLINIRSVTTATNSTILLFSYLPPNFPATMQYIAIPVEQVVEMIYSSYAMPLGSSFTSVPPAGVLPLFSVDLSNRSTDIKNIFDLLNVSSPYHTSTSSVSLQTTLGNSYTLATTGFPTITNGLIPNIQSITIIGNGTMMLVGYQVGVVNGTIVVTPDQVYGIVYSTN